MNAQIKGHLLGALWGLGIVLLLKLITGCGTDQGATPVLQADPSTGAVTVKGDKGDTGPAGKDGTNGKDGRDGVNGKDGANGRDGKDGKDAVVDSTWRDPQTGKRWLLAGPLTSWAHAQTLCGAWKLPDVALLRAAVDHGLARNLPTFTKAAGDMAWTTQKNANDEGLAVYLYAPSSAAQLTTASHHVYCYE